MEISQILENNENFTQRVSMLLESGKSMLEEIKQLRLLDTANEEIYALLQNAKHVLLNIPGGC